MEGNPPLIHPLLDYTMNQNCYLVTSDGHEYCILV